MSDIYETPPYVRLAEAIFVVEVTSSSNANSLLEWRHAWTEQQVSPRTGAYSAANPARRGTTTVNYLTDLEGRRLAPGPYWARLKDSVGNQQVYEAVGCCGGGPAYSIDFGSTTPQTDVAIPPGTSVLFVEGDQPITLTSVVLEDNQWLTIVNEGDFPIIIPHQDGGTPEYEFTTPHELDLVLAPGDKIRVFADPDTGFNIVTETTAPINRPPVEFVIESGDTPVIDLVLPPNTPTITIDAPDEIAELVSIVPPTLDQTFLLTITVPSDSPFPTRVLIDDPGAGDPEYAFYLQTDLAGDVPYVEIPIGGSIQVTFVPGQGFVIVDFPNGTKPSYQPTLTGTVDDQEMPFYLTTLMPILSAPTTITGFTGLTPGQQFTIGNPPTNAFDLTLAHLDGGSDIDFSSSTGTDLVLEPGSGIVTVTVSPDGTLALESGGSIGVVSDNVGGSGGMAWVLRATITHADLTDADTSQDIALTTQPITEAVGAAVIITRIAGSGGGVATLNMQFLREGSPVGSAGNGLSTTNRDGQYLNTASNGYFPFAIEGGAVSWAVQFTSIGGNLVGLSAGSWEVYFLTASVP